MTKRGKHSIKYRKRKRQEHFLRNLLFSTAYNDKVQGESVNVLTNREILEKLCHTFQEVHIIPDHPRGEIIKDTRQRGSLQKY